MAGTSKRQGTADSCREGAAASSTKVTSVVCCGLEQIHLERSFLDEDIWGVQAWPQLCWRLQLSRQLILLCILRLASQSPPVLQLYHAEEWQSPVAQVDLRPLQVQSPRICRPQDCGRGDCALAEAPLSPRMLGVVRQSHSIWCHHIGTCKAVLGIDLADQPLPIGAAFHMLPNALPSHPKGLDKRLFKPPYSKTLTPPNHPSEVGLPWLVHQKQLAKAPEKELTSWVGPLLQHCAGRQHECLPSLICKP